MPRQPPRKLVAWGVSRLYTKPRVETLAMGIREGRMKRPARRGLGRGLGDLLRSGDGSGGVVEVEIDQIVENPHQPRVVTSTSLLKELEESIRQHGVLQPLLVTQAGLDGKGRPRYQLIAGERRWQASRSVGLKRIPVMVKEVTPIEILSLALVENVQRADLNPLEEAMAYRQLIEEFGLTQADVARQVGKSRSAVANVVRLANLQPAVKEALFSGKIDEGHARALLGLPEEEQQSQALDRVLAGRLSVRATEQMVRNWLAEGGPEATTPDSSPNDLAAEDTLRSALGTKVKLLRSGDGGRLVIHFYSNEQLAALFDLLTSHVAPAGEEFFEVG